MLPIFNQAQLHPHAIAILDSSGEYTYGSLMEKSSQIALHLLQGKVDLNKCKHLACSEVRAALFTDKCKVMKNGLELGGASTSEKFDA